MGILNFQKPDEVLMIDSDEFQGRFEFKPLEPGYGLTVGNAIRRVLLSSLEGYAITSLKMSGIAHEFSSIKGVMEDVTEIVLNLKQIRLKQIVDIDTEQVNISISGKEKILSEDIGSFLSNFEVINKDLLICNLDPSVKLEFQITIEKGRGFVSSEENKRVPVSEGVIVMDSVFTPIKNVKYSIENFRVEQKTDYEKLLMDIKTDGSITPKDALKEASKILIHHFALFSDEKISTEADGKRESDVYDDTVLRMRKLLKTNLTDLDLSVRALNCLRTAEIDTLEQLVGFREDDLMKFRNFGRKTLVELQSILDVKGLSFGMDLSIYGLK
ncbi:DNA-directed RNA polymerase subunit alpha [Ichthyobacterium seriolicida]|uniref:DNA-directed RNA polymerase subunit alpha n=1 Tax=Ichthyobacterium seriolicida TaxID=242600 RepID=A0A1J1DY67_9FLAO|nr:DNA-directed RNA polymerase subunit alpha [Ichthyobacterium seriolicida]BAV94834.1 DNA-directed RNA polymerase alpha subunit [Ichthyobacterium seriolicida]